MIRSHSLSINYQTKFFSLNELTNKTKRIWIVFHGYGMLAEYFLKKFEILDSEENHIIAPQGLSRFYLENPRGRVGASWMTKDDRLIEIQNQQSYLGKVMESIGNIIDKEIIFFGFSQGTATMGRFAAFSKLPFKKMVLWAGDFPHDVEAGAFDFITGEEEIHYYTSKEDPFFKEEMIEKQDKLVKEATGIAPILHWYEGGHKVIPELVAKI